MSGLGSGSLGGLSAITFTDNTNGHTPAKWDTNAYTSYRPTIYASGKTYEQVQREMEAFIRLNDAGRLNLQTLKTEFLPLLREREGQTVTITHEGREVIMVYREGAMHVTVDGQEHRL